MTGILQGLKTKFSIFLGTKNIFNPYMCWFSTQKPHNLPFAFITLSLSDSLFPYCFTYGQNLYIHYLFIFFCLMIHMLVIPCQLSIKIKRGDAIPLDMEAVQEGP